MGSVRSASAPLMGGWLRLRASLLLLPIRRVLLGMPCACRLCFGWCGVGGGAPGDGGVVGSVVFIFFMGR